MATNYPGSLDSGTQQPSPSSSTEMDDSGFEHDVVHTNHSEAIIALETKVGTGSSTAVADSVLASTGSGTSGWTTTPTVTGLTVDGDTSSTGHFTAQSGGADSGIVLGQAFSTDYVGLRTAGMAEASGDEYVLISDGAITLLSGGTNGDVYIRGGANNSSCQILLDTSENNVAVTGTLSVSGIVTLSDEIKGGSGSAADPVFTFASDGDTGMYSHAADQLGFTAGGTRRMVITTSAIFGYEPFRAQLGSAAEPSFAFDGDTDTGFYRYGGGTIGWSGNNNTGGYLFNGGIRTDSGTAGAPSHSFSTDSDTGMYRLGTNTIGFSCQGLERMRIGTYGIIVNSDGTTNTGDPIIGGSPGSASSPSYTFNGDTDTGMYRYGTNAIGWSLGGNTRLMLDNNGSYGRLFGPGLRTGSAIIRGEATAASPVYTFYADENTGMYRTGTDRIGFSCGGALAAEVRSDGIHLASGDWFRSYGSTGWYNGTYGGGWNMTDTSWIRAYGNKGIVVPGGMVATLATHTSTTGYKYVQRNTTYGTLSQYNSSRDFKDNITNVTASDAAAWIDSLQPVTFVSKWMSEEEEPEEARAWREADIQVGFIAEDVLANSTSSQFAQVEDVDGTLKGAGWKWECVIAASVAEIKSLRARVAALEAA